MQKVRRWRNST